MPVTVNGNGPISGVSQITQTQMPLVGGSPIVESGSNGNGSWVKFSDGTMICHGSKDVGSINVNNAMGGLFYGTAIDITWPAAFIAAPAPSIVLHGSAGLVFGSYGANSANSAAVYPQNPISATMTVVAYFSAIGRWK